MPNAQCYLSASLGAARSYSKLTVPTKRNAGLGLVSAFEAPVEAVAEVRGGCYVLRFVGKHIKIMFAVLDFPRRCIPVCVSHNTGL